MYYILLNKKKLYHINEIYTLIHLITQRVSSFKFLTYLSLVIVNSITHSTRFFWSSVRTLTKYSVQVRKSISYDTQLLFNSDFF